MNVRSPGWGYRLLSLPLLLFWTLHALIHGFKRSLPRYLRLRTSALASDGQHRVWVHAASVGEVHAVTPLVQALMQQGEKILFTSFTATGYQAIQHGFPDSVYSGVIPFDNCWHCRRFFGRHNIKLGLVMETELWPELLYQARKQRIPLLLVSARLTPKSLQAGKFVSGLLSTTLAYFTHILARSGKDREALLSMGVSEDRITLPGNLKSHAQTAPRQPRQIERDYLILASSHQDEEQQFLQARPAEFEHLLLVLAPRHPDRSAAIQTQVERLGMNCAVRSKAQAIEQNTEVYLADTLGELKSFLTYARVVIMGGSFDTTGGHNLLEPAALGCAIITGPSDSNIAEDIKMLGINDGVLQVESMTACWQAIAELLENPARAEALGREAQSRLAQQPDIIQQYLVAIEPYL
jgi:3-deoxy-D-manno-octulosonic-acid transferase